MHAKTKQLVMAALMASMVCVATMIIKIPSPMKGYINLGDCIVLLCGWLFAPGYAFAAAGLGSALADMFAGYMTYAPATFLIKGTMALIAGICMRWMSRRLGRLPAQIIGGVLAELIMILGYFLFEGILYGFAPSAVNIPANGVQGVAGLMLGVALIKVFERLKISFE
jgi:uncharacterized membrane protein